MKKNFISIMSLMLIFTSALSFNAFELSNDLSNDQESVSSDKALNPSEDTSVCKPAEEPFNWSAAPDTPVCMPDPQFRKFVNDKYFGKGKVDDAITWDQAVHAQVDTDMEFPEGAGITDITGVSALGRYSESGESNGVVMGVINYGNDISSYAPLSDEHLTGIEIQNSAISPEAFHSLAQFRLNSLVIIGTDLSDVTPEQFREDFTAIIEKNNHIGLSLQMQDASLNTEQMQAIWDTVNDGELTSFAVGYEGEELGMIEFDPTLDYSKLRSFVYLGSSEQMDLAEFPPMPNLDVLSLYEVGLTQDMVDENLTPEKYPKLTKIYLDNDTLYPDLDTPSSGEGDRVHGLQNGVYDLSFVEAWSEESLYPIVRATNQVMMLDPTVITELPESVSYDYNMGVKTGDSKSTEVPLVLGDNHVESSYEDGYYEPGTVDHTLIGRVVSGVFIQDVYYQKSPEATVTDYSMDEVLVDSGFSMTDEEIKTAMEYTVTDTGSSKPGTTVELSSSEESVTPLTIDYTKPGDYPVYFFTTNADDQTTVESAVFTVKDLSPTIDVTTSSITVEEGSAPLDLIADFGVTASEITSGDLTTEIEATSTVDYSTPGTYPVNYTVVDDEGNEDTDTAEITIVAAADPVVTVSDYAMNEVAVDSGFTMTDEEIETAMGYTVVDSGSTTSSEVTVELSSTADVVTPLAIDYTIPGEYPVYFFTTNAAGHTTVEDAVLSITDLLPEIAVTTSNLTVEEGATALDLIADFGVTATEITSGDLTPEIEATSTVDYSTPGTYPVNYTVVDDEGNEDTDTAEITIVAAADPVVTVSDYTMTEVTVDSGFTMTDEEIETAMGYTVVDSGSTTSSEVTVELSSTADVVTPLAIDYTTPGEYPVYFFTTNAAGHTTVEGAVLTITDLLPEISLTTSSITVQKGSSELDLISNFGVTASEITSGDLTTEIEATSTVDYSTPGTYPVNYTVVDDEGNEDTDTAEIIVEAAPVVSGTPEVTVTNYAMSEVTVDSGFTMTDEEIEAAMEYTVVDSGSTTSSEVTVELSSTADVVTPLTIDYTVPGAYPVYFFTTNVDGQTSVAQGIFTVTDLLPEIDVTTSSMTVEKGSEELDLIADFGVTATEFTDGDLTTEIEATSTVDYSTPGTYPVNYTVVDDEGNEDTDTAEIIVEAGPVVSGTPEVTVTNYTMSEVPVDSGFTMTDEEIEAAMEYTVVNSGSATSSEVTVELSSTADAVKPLTIDYTVPGEYSVYFFTTNVDGQTSVAQGIFTVTDLLPEIDVTTSSMTVEKGSEELDLIADFGVTATEFTDGDLTTEIEATSTVDYSTPGTYPVNYTVVDDEGNEDTDTAEIVVEKESQITEGADFTVDKTASPVGDGSVNVEVGDEIDYTISMNSNSYIPNGITIIDPLSTNLELEEETIALSLDGSVIDSTVEFDETTNTIDVETNQPINIGDEVALTFSTTVVDDEGGKVENVATVSTNDDAVKTSKETPSTMHNIVDNETVIPEKPSEDDSEVDNITEETSEDDSIVESEDDSEVDNTITEETSEEKSEITNNLETTGGRVVISLMVAMVALLGLFAVKVYIRLFN